MPHVHGGHARARLGVLGRRINALFYLHTYADRTGGWGSEKACVIATVGMRTYTVMSACFVTGLAAGVFISHIVGKRGIGAVVMSQTAEGPGSTDSELGTMHKLGCPDVNDASRCTDKVGGNTGKPFERVSPGLADPHGYDRWYEPMFQRLRGKRIRLLEIGMKDGASAKLWRSYFPKADIYGLDYDPTNNDNAIRSTEQGIRVVLGDQAKISDLERLVEQTGGNFDIIIDDGGHTPTQQLVSFDYLFSKALKPGGIYSVEDIETSYWTNGELYTFRVEAGLHKRGTAMEVFKQIADTVNRVYIPTGTVPNKQMFQVFRSGSDAMVETIQFAANCVIMTKKGAWDKGWDDRDQSKMPWGHKGLYSGETYKLGRAVDTVDADRRTQRALVNDFVLPTY